VKFNSRLLVKSFSTSLLVGMAVGLDNIYRAERPDFSFLLPVWSPLLDSSAHRVKYCTAHHATCFPTFLSIKRVRQHLPGRCISNKLTEPYRVPKPRILIPDPPPRQKQTRKLKTLLPQSQIHTRKSYFVLWVNNVHSPLVHFVTVLLVWVLMYCETGR